MRIYLNKNEFEAIRSLLVTQKEFEIMNRGKNREKNCIELFTDYLLENKFKEFKTFRTGDKVKPMSY